MGFTDTSLIWRVAFIITCFAFLFTLGGLSSAYMAATELIPNMWMHIGLWDICDDTKSFSCKPLEQFLTETGDSSDWLHGARAMAVMSIMLLGFLPVLSLYLTYAASSNQLTAVVIGVLDLVAVIFGSIGGVIFIVFGLDLLERTVEMYAQPSWSFVIYMIGQFLVVCASGMNFYDACRDDMD